VDVDVTVAVNDTLIVAVHVNGNDTVIVIRPVDARDAIGAPPTR
jgi:hypothetical protein